ncbi:MAG: glycosyl transferase family 2 [Verrucomicrobia bacterium]|nr:glycosyl transferase family 2 [Verrucomicrobiota bacterium]
MTPAFVSIIIPCYNAERWLAATLESALAQSWPEKEIIVVNDGSTDSSRAIARSHEPRGVRVIDQKNRGAAAARNAGLRAARGEFIQYLDADDLLSPGKISAQIPLLGRSPADRIASCRWGRFTDDPQRARFVDEAVFRDFLPVEFLIQAGETGAMMHPSAWLVPRAVADRAGPWDETLSLNDDGEYFARVALAGSGLAFCADDAARSYYRSGLAGSLSQQRSDQARRSQFQSLVSITGRLLAAEDSPRTRRACAGYWRRFVHDFYPAPADLLSRAEAEVRRFGESVGRPAMGPKTAALARVIGWRNVWRLKHRMQR